MFVKKIRDRINERLDLENEGIDSLSVGPNKQKQNEEYIDSMGVKRSEYIDNKNSQPYLAYTTDLLGVGEGETGAIDDLLGLGGGSS